MQKDAELLAQQEHQPNPTLHLYRWEGRAATHGYFAKPEALLKMEVAELIGLRLARRPTGGGLILHDYDFAFSIVLPIDYPGISANTLGNYALVNGMVMSALQNLLPQQQLSLFPGKAGCAHHRPKFCMAEGTRYDIFCEGKKLVGAAQRKTRHGLLHQGSICIQIPPSNEGISLLGKKAYEAMTALSFPLSTLQPDLSLEEWRVKIEKSLLEALHYPSS